MKFRFLLTLVSLHSVTTYALANSETEVRHLLPSKLHKADPTTNENEIASTRRKNDKTWIVGYLD